MDLRRIAALTSAAIALTLTAACGTEHAGAAAPAPAPSKAAPATPAATTTPAVPLDLQKTEQAVGDQARGSDVYGDEIVQSEDHLIVLYVTDTDKGQALLRAAKAAHPDIDTGLVHLKKCRYARKTLDAAMDRVMKASEARSLPYLVYSASPTHDSSGLNVTAAAEAVASTTFRQKVQAAVGTIPVAFAPGGMVTAL
ncbi:hypothetical protein QMK19_11190 [Streptomyces sp. H10-C2]|uniref:hypothetical protein n=1 Tax=unclassified Streptomyces TaxID=2593676 RepID=UPI0024BB116A|nr:MULTISPECIES: hypothetical protein [unclassified Streptomyces]MDJ0340575.1 hypothetical protein [Streptomyces sp. PH10-H1]MDJ0370223.1 hypothetical protein [Streptomyces sp. H10-C2]